MKYFRMGLYGMVIATLLSGCATPFEMAQTSQKAGDAAYKRGNYKGAIENYKKAISQDPVSSPTTTWRYKNLGDAYFKNGNYKEALIAYKQCLESTYKGNLLDDYPNALPSYRGGRLSDIEECYKALKDYDGAVSFMEQLIAKDPNNYHYFRELGSMYTIMGQYDKGIAATKRAIELHPQDAGPYNTLGYAYGKKKKYDEAFKAFRKSIELNPKNYSAYNFYGKFLTEKRDYKDAAAAFRKAAELRPSILLYWIHLASTYYYMGEYNKALEAGSKALIAGIGAKIKMEDLPTVVNVMAGAPADAAGIGPGDKITAIDGTSTKGWKLTKFVEKCRGPAGTSVILTISRNGKSFEKYVTRALFPSKESVAALAVRSLAYRKVGKLEDARKEATKAFDLMPEDENAKIAMAAAYLDGDHYDNATQLLSGIEKSTTARVLEATAYAKQGNYKKATDIYSAIPEEKLSPRDVPLWSDRAVLLEAFKPFIISKVQKAVTFKEQGRYKEALKELGDALKASDDKESKQILSAVSGIIKINPELSELPEEARKYALRGDMLTEEGKFEEAVTQYRKAVQGAYYIAKLHFNAAMLYGKLKKYPQAIKHMTAYLLLAPEALNARAAKDQIYKWEFMMEEGK